MWGVLSESQEALLTDSLKLVRQASSLLSASNGPCNSGSLCGAAMMLCPSLVWSLLPAAGHLFFCHSVQH